MIIIIIIIMLILMLIIDNAPAQLASAVAPASPTLREVGDAPRNPAPRNHFLVWILKSPGCHCPDAFGGKDYRRVPTPLRSPSPLSATWLKRRFSVSSLPTRPVRQSCCRNASLILFFSRFRSFRRGTPASVGASRLLTSCVCACCFVVFCSHVQMSLSVLFVLWLLTSESYIGQSLQTNLSRHRSPSLPVLFTASRNACANL